MKAVDMLGGSSGTEGISHCRYICNSLLMITYLVKGQSIHFKEDQAVIEGHKRLYNIFRISSL